VFLILRDEQDKLSVIEGQLDELIRTMGSTAETSGRNRPTIYADTDEFAHRGESVDADTAR
jgi:hypothetical protein